MALHAVEERSSISAKLGWEGSTLLRPAAELGAIAGLSLLIGAVEPPPAFRTSVVANLTLPDGPYESFKLLVLLCMFCC